MWPSRLRVAIAEAESVRKLAVDMRCAYAIKRIVDTKEAWVLWTDELGIAMYKKGATNVIPLWPAHYYATNEAHARGLNETAVPVYLGDILDRWVEELEEEGWSFAIFPEEPTILSPREFERRVYAELENYE